MAQIKERVYDFAEKYKKVFLDPESTMESIEDSGFPQECYQMNFGDDGGRKFIVATPDSDAFNDVMELERVIDEVDNYLIIGSALSGKWQLLDELTQMDKMWFALMLNRLMELTEEEESMSVQELSQLLREHRDEIVENTEIDGWDIDLWIQEPEQIMNLDSGIAYDLCRILDISIYDIIDAVEREEMLTAMF